MLPYKDGMIAEGDKILKIQNIRKLRVDQVGTLLRPKALKNVTQISVIEIPIQLRFGKRRNFVHLSTIRE